jgi:hypothetical protein
MESEPPAHPKYAKVSKTLAAASAIAGLNADWELAIKRLESWGVDMTLQVTLTVALSVYLAFMWAPNSVREWLRRFLAADVQTKPRKFYWYAFLAGTLFMGAVMGVLSAETRAWSIAFAVCAAVCLFFASEAMRQVRPSKALAADDDRDVPPTAEIKQLEGQIETERKLKNGAQQDLTTARSQLSDIKTERDQLASANLAATERASSVTQQLHEANVEREELRTRVNAFELQKKQQDFFEQAKSQFQDAFSKANPSRNEAWRATDAGIRVLNAYASQPIASDQELADWLIGLEQYKSAIPEAAHAATRKQLALPTSPGPKPFAKSEVFQNKFNEEHNAALHEIHGLVGQYKELQEEAATRQDNMQEFAASLAEQKWNRAVAEVGDGGSPLEKAVLAGTKALEGQLDTQPLSGDQLLEWMCVTDGIRSKIAGLVHMGPVNHGFRLPAGNLKLSEYQGEYSREQRKEMTRIEFNIKQLKAFGEHRDL